jgi:hypothetical protein
LIDWRGLNDLALARECASGTITRWPMFRDRLAVYQAFEIRRVCAARSLKSVGDM